MIAFASFQWLIWGMSDQAGESDADTDHLTYEVTNPNGEVEIYQFTIHIRSD